MMRTRMSSRSTLILVGALFNLLGCSAEKGTSQAETAQAQNCASLQKVVADDVGLAVPPASDLGTIVQARLSQDLSCSNASVVWSVTGGKIVSQNQSGLALQVSRLGSYAISAKITDSTGVVSSLSETTTAVGQAPVLQGPQAIMIGQEALFTILNSSDPSVSVAIREVSWDWGDGSQSTGLTASHVYELSGSYMVNAQVILNDGVTYALKQTLTAIEYFDGLECLGDAKINSEQTAEKGASISFLAQLPSCLTGVVSSVKWSFQDGSSSIFGTAVQHSFQQVGTYVVTAEVSSPLSEGGVLFRMSQRVQVSEKDQAFNCATLNEVKTEDGVETSRQVACGIDGVRTDVVKTRRTLTCQFVDPGQDWVLSKEELVVVREGECQGQSCELSDGRILKDLEKVTMYREATPVLKCADGQSERICQNGVLSGDSSATQFTCVDGCGDFGAHGTVKKGVIIGTAQEAVTCSFGEEGVFKTLQLLADQSCQAGSVHQDTVYHGEILDPGLCPIYHWQASDNWSVCSQNCGGTQDRLFVCQNQKGEIADEQRCVEARPQESRICDGDPGAEERIEETSADEEVLSSRQCPKNQIGVFLKTRTVVTKTQYACVEHRVKQTDTKLIPGAWVENGYCRDYVAYRCSHDSLSNREAHERFLWMEKCQDASPAIREFLQRFDDVETRQSAGIDSASRVLYPTFMKVVGGKDQVWKAPVKGTASCEAPANIYVAAVCVSSCVTPEEQIVTEIKGRSLQTMSFLEALLRGQKQVMTLAAEGRRNAGPLSVKKTRVEQWVTELVESDHEMIELKMRSGGGLLVTPNHPLVVASGEMRQARDLGIGDSLVRMDGQADEIVAIQSRNYFGKVYNLFTQSSGLMENIVITNGYLNGTAFYQNEGAQNLNRKILRRRLIEGVR